MDLGRCFRGRRRFHLLETIVRSVPPWNESPGYRRNPDVSRRILFSLRPPGNESPGYQRNPAEAGWGRLGVVWPLLVVMVLAAMPFAAVAAETPTWWLDAVREGERKGYRVINLEELAALSQAEEDLLLIDARPAYEYRAGHIPGAANLEFHPGDKVRFSAEKRRQLKNLIGPDKDRPVVIYCRSFR
jgi:rhodanese-related sulfurtransferase